MNMKQGSIYAIIPARGGSKGLPGKNVRLLNGRPLIDYTIQAALDCPGIGRCIVSTEDKEIRDVSLACGAEVFKRPIELAGDLTSSPPVVTHVLETLCQQEDLPDYIVVLQPTSPLRTSKHLTECIDSFMCSDANCAIGVTEALHSPYKDFHLEEDGLVPLFDEKNLNAARQTLPVIYKQNGAIYLMSSQLFQKYHHFYIRPAMPYMMDANDSVDIDTELDFMMVERLTQLLAEDK